MSTSHLPVGSPLPPTPHTVLPLLHHLGDRSGHRLVLLSLEVWEGWSDLRFARIDIGADRPLKRRVPPAEAWRLHLDGEPVVVHDAVGRGERSFSNGEVRLIAVPQPGQRLDVEVALVAEAPVLAGSLLIPTPHRHARLTGEAATG